MSLVDILVYIFLAIGVFFNLLAGFGLLRFPDVYTRLHAGTKCTTFGSIFLCGSVILIGLRMWWFNNPDSDGSILTIHTVIALFAIMLTNPTGAHAIARAAHRSGVKPVGAVIDELEGESGKKASSVKKEVKK
jgi:multicomponent Na+:H+ antiporter subunit G